eukprot:scaffold178277_cov24-Tisochrysis_lutea.AAC.1
MGESCFGDCATMAPVGGLRLTPSRGDESAAVLSASECRERPHRGTQGSMRRGRGGATTAPPPPFSLFPSFLLPLSPSFFHSSRLVFSL